MKKRVLKSKGNVFRLLLLAPALYFNFVVLTQARNSYVVSFSVFVAVFLLIAATQYFRWRRIAYYDGETLRIRGVFRLLSVPAAEVSSIRVSKDYLCYILDFRKVTINGKSVYTADFDMEEFRKFMSS